ncbi:MAG: hypothetical protein AMXMBFR13_41270 [Phycisphaerae bacterium]
MHTITFSLLVAAAVAMPVQGPTAPSPAMPVVVLSEEGVSQGATWSIDAEGHVILSGHHGQTTAAQPEVVIRSPVLLNSRGSLTAAMRPAVTPAPPGSTPVTDNHRAGRSAASAPATESFTAPPSPRGLCFLHTRGGEIVRGMMKDARAPARVAMVNALLGDVNVPLADVARLGIGRPARGTRMPAEGDAPLLVLTNADLVNGEIGAIGAQGVTIASEFGDTQVELPRVRELVLAHEPPVLDGRRAGQSILLLDDGQCWYVDALAAGAKPAHIRAQRADATAEIPVEQVRRIIFPGCTVRELIASEAPTVQTTPYLDETVRVDVDTPDRRRPRMIGAELFGSGITASPRSRVTYSVSGARFLLGWVGLDPLRGRNGVCDLRVEVNNQTAWSLEGVTAKAGVRRFAVPLPEKCTINLITDFGPRGETGDHVHWCDLLLVDRNSPRSR